MPRFHPFHTLTLRGGCDGGMEAALFSHDPVVFYGVRRGVRRERSFFYLLSSFFVMGVGVEVGVGEEGGTLLPHPKGRRRRKRKTRQRGGVRKIIFFFHLPFPLPLRIMGVVIGIRFRRSVLFQRKNPIGWWEGSGRGNGSGDR